MKKQKLHNPIETLKFRKELRSNLTPAEAFLWSYLKSKQLEGKKFRRQHGIGPFIVDFYCASEQLTIELDGKVHMNERAQQYDVKRTKYL